MFKAVYAIGRIASRSILTNKSIFQKTVTPQKALLQYQHVKPLSTLLSQTRTLPEGLLLNPIVQNIGQNIIIKRSVTKFSIRKGKRKSVKAVLRRFYRLHWGIWIRTKCGRNKKLWKKSSPRKRRLRQHVFCNATQSRMLDKMVGSYWMKPKYYVDDPYSPYHNREYYRFTRTKPRPYNPPELENH